MWTRGWRDEVWSRLDQPWDLIIVGGGITGAGILGEAVRHGKRALLIEAQDFSSGTSSRSTKLVHGGLRYLRDGHFLLTRESVLERERLMREGEGLVDSLGFVLAAFSGDRIPKWMYGVGLAMYDALAGKWHHQGQTRAQLLARLPPLADSDVVGGYHYFDAQTDDSRLVVRVLREAVKRGGTAINYARAESLLRTHDGSVCGVVLRDTASGAGRTVEIQAKIVINATGAWADDLRSELGHRKRIRRIRGSHLTFASNRLPIREALSLIHPRDGRAVFALPWEGTTVVGTTDIDHGALDEEPAISNEEVTYLLEVVRRAFPSYAIEAKDIVSTWSGVRPVINTGKADPSKESREHAIWNENGLLTITGGKLTTFARMARDALGAARREIGPLEARGRVLDEPATTVRWPASFDDATKVRFLGRYGAEVGDVLSDHANATPIEGTVCYWSELSHAARAEGVVTLADLLLRRVRIGLFLPEGGQAKMASIRAVAQPALGWDDDRWEVEEARYVSTWRRAYSVPA